MTPNDAAQARRAQGVRHGTETPSRRCLEPPGWAIPLTFQHSFCAKLKALSHAVIELEHAVLVCRAEPQGVLESALCEEVFAAAPGALTLRSVEFEHQRRP